MPIHLYGQHNYKGVKMEILETTNLPSSLNDATGEYSDSLNNALIKNGFNGVSTTIKIQGDIYSNNLSSENAALVNTVGIVYAINGETTKIDSSDSNMMYEIIGVGSKVLDNSDLELVIEEKKPTTPSLFGDIDYF